MDVLGTSTRDFTPAGQRRYQKNSNPWPASSALPTNSSTLMNTDAPTETSSIHEEDNDDQDATREVKEKSVRDQFLKTPTNKPAPAKTKAGQSAAANMTNTKPNGATASPPCITPWQLPAQTPSAQRRTWTNKTLKTATTLQPRPSKQHY